MFFSLLHTGKRDIVSCETKHVLPGNEACFTGKRDIRYRETKHVLPGNET